MLTTKPLSGVTVLEIGHSIAAPYAGMILAELGADVVKLEQPGGDYARDWGPPFAEGAATAFHAVNRGKRGITVDLSDGAARQRLKAFIQSDVDVVIHNLKFGALEKLGLAPEKLVAAKPSLIHCNVGAFGAVGPLKERPGYDPLMQAFGGLMSLIGEEGASPSRVAVSIVDMGTGMWAAIGILGALLERSRSGRGGIVDTSLYETSLAWMTVPITAFLASGVMQKKTGSANAQIVPYQAFETSDGFLMVAAGNDRLFKKLVDCLDLTELAVDPRFVTNADRVINREALIEKLAAAFKTQSLSTWHEKLDAVGVPTGPIHSVDQVVAHPQTEALGIMQSAPEGTVNTLGLPLSFDGARPAFERSAPALGQHNNEILRLDDD